VKRYLLPFCLIAVTSAAVTPPSAGEITRELQNLSIDPGAIYHARDLHLSRGGASIYLTDGVLAFARPVDGRRIAAIFTTSGVDAGDAEVLVSPPRRSERISLARFAKTPNLDEHFSSALFVFSDGTASELNVQLASAAASPGDWKGALPPDADTYIRAITGQLSTQIVQSLLGGRGSRGGFFYAGMLGHDIGPFDLLYEPDTPEPVTLGRVASKDGHSAFELWTAFRTNDEPPYHAPAPAISAYRIETTIMPDLSLSAEADIDLTAPAQCGRVLRFNFSDRLKVLWAEVDGQPVEMFQRQQVRTSDFSEPGSFLLVAKTPFVTGSRHVVKVRYQGSVIRRTDAGAYFVSDRDAWYPSMEPTFATFDLTFRCPEALRVVSTGEPVSEEVRGGVRIVHRKTAVPEHVAGFNVGEYESAIALFAPYRIECYMDAPSEGVPLAGNAEEPASQPLASLLRQTGEIMENYTRLWGPLPIHNIAVSPVPGYFGQGLAGLIYLSSVSYLPLDKRPAKARGPRQDSFFSDLLLPHEVAHQWWGNIVRAGDYRSAWLIEAMAEDSALEYLQRTKGSAAIDAILERYRDDLLRENNGASIDSAGPLDFGVRLIGTAGFESWQAITYEKGAWVLHMLRVRLGEKRYHQFQLALLAQYASEPLTNEDFRQLASRFLPPGETDQTLANFFDAWVYSTGIPTLRMRGNVLEVSGVADDFSADIPLLCRLRSGAQTTRWTRAISGRNPIRFARGETCGLPNPTEFLYSH
jgi:hypothetical protein